MKKIVVNNLIQGKRLDGYIAENTDLSRSEIQRLIKDERVLVNEKKITKASFAVNNGDVILVDEEIERDVGVEAENIPLNIVYEDDDFLVVDKPKGMVVHPAVGNPRGTLANAVLYYCNGNVSKLGGDDRPGIVHRLDKDTSGLIIVAKNDKVHNLFTEMLKNHEIKKTYIALVRGNIPEDEATVDMPIGRSKSDRKKMAVDRDGKNAVTHFKVLKRIITDNGEYTLLEVNLETGRTHQIRVHMAEIRHPVVGDEVYSNGRNEFGIKGQALHAYKLDFIHPITKKEMHIESDLPEWYKLID